MPGYRPLLFYTTPSLDQHQQVITNIITLLSEKYMLQNRFPESVGAILFDEYVEKYNYVPIDEDIKDIRAAIQRHQWLVVDAVIVLGSIELGISIKFMPVSHDDRRVVVLIDLSGNLYDSFFTKNISLKKRKIERQKQAFLRFCVDIAKSINVDGFVVRDPIEPPPPIDYTKLMDGFFDLTDSSDDFMGSLNGVSITTMDVPSIRQSNTRYVFRDFLILDYI